MSPLGTLRTVGRAIREDITATMEQDPAAKSRIEVLLTYPGLHAVWLYRIAHRLWAGDHHLAARLLSHFARFLTGVEIHPGARIGRRLCIDHGAGVVIGETADVGDDVLLYHGVTLGGDSQDPVKRHPTLCDDVTVGANATLIGAITVGEGATVGAGSVLTDDVPPAATVAGVPAKRVDGRETPEPLEDTDVSDCEPVVGRPDT